MPNRQDDDNSSTFTDTVFGFFGVPAARGRKKAVDLSTHAVNASQCVIEEANQLHKALDQLARTLSGPSRK